jgi:outer membrane protein assembly factor BamB
VEGDRFKSTAGDRKRSERRFRGARLAALAAVASLGLGAAGCDWTQLGYDSGHTGFNWTETTVGPRDVGKLTLAWRTGADTGAIHSSPAVAGGQVFLGGDNGKLMAFPTSCQTAGGTCDPTWEGTFSGVTRMSAPAVANGKVFVTGLGRDLEFLLGFPQSGTGSACTDATPPTCSPFVKYGPAGDGSVAYATQSAPTISNGLVWASSGPFTGDAGNVDLLSGADETTSPGVQWSTILPGNNGTASNVAVADGMVFVKTSANSLLAYPTAAPNADVMPLWSVSDPYAGQAGPAVANGVVYSPGGDGNLYAYSATTGARLWEGRVPGGGPASTPAIANGFVYMTQAHATAGQTSKLYAFSANGCAATTCDPAWTGATGGKQATTSPTLANGLVYVGTGNPGALQAFVADGCGLSSCQPIYTYVLPKGNVTTPAVVADGSVYFGSDSAGEGLYALSLPAASSSIATAAHGAPSSAVRHFAGAGSHRLGTITLREPTMVRWSARAGARVSFTVNGTQHQIVLHQRSGQYVLPPNVYSRIRITTTGRWSIDLRNDTP